MINYKEGNNDIADVNSCRHCAGVGVRGSGFIHTGPFWKFGFTLAEVLITLGIIGVVAALTLPALVAKYKHKALETAFKKVYSELLQATQEVPIEFSYCDNNNSSEINDFIESKYNAAMNKNAVFFFVYNNDNIFTYNKLKASGAIHFNPLTFGTNKYILTSSGAVVALGTHDSAANAVLIGVDTNGPRKGPNAFGHDLFFFYIGSRTNCRITPFSSQVRSCTEDETDCGDNGWKWTSGVCSRTSSNSDNGFACTSYAIKNVCPDDSTKTYWDCLP